MSHSSWEVCGLLLLCMRISMMSASCCLLCSSACACITSCCLLMSSSIATSWLFAEDSAGALGSFRCRQYCRLDTSCCVQIMRTGLPPCDILQVL